MFNCLECGQESAIWQCDYDAEDLGYEQEGVVSVYYCSNCDSEIIGTTLENESDTR